MFLTNIELWLFINSSPISLPAGQSPKYNRHSSCYQGNISFYWSVSFSNLYEKNLYFQEVIIRSIIILIIVIIL